jgi:O-antigen/teichoic acid export membrane protein
MSIQSVPPTNQSDPPKPRRHVVVNAVFSILTKGQAVVFSYTITRLLLHRMEVEDYGLYSVLFIGILLNIHSVIGLGIPNLFVRFVPELAYGSRYRTLARMFHRANFVQIAVAAILLAIAFLLAPQLAVLIKFPGKEAILRIFFIGALAYIVQENFMMLLSGLFKQRIIFTVIIGYNLIRLASIFYITQYDYSLEAVTIVEVIALTAGVILYIGAYRRFVHPLIVQDTTPHEPGTWRRFTRYTILSYINELGAVLIVEATDLLLITGILGSIVVGYYGVADRITTMARNFLPNAVLKSVIEPAFFSEYGSLSKSGSVRFGFNLLARTLFFIALPIGLWLALMAKPVIVYLFEARYAEAAGPLTVMALFVAIGALHMPLRIMLENAERIDLTICSKVAAVLKILLGLWLVPKWGVMAMVWISGLSIFLQDAILYAFIAIKLEVRADLLGLLRLCINGAASALLFLLIRGIFTGLTGVFLSALCFGTIYLAINILHKTFHPEERAFINRHLPRPLWVF